MIREELQSILRDVLNDENVLLTGETVFTDLPGWDSLAHINTLFAIEERFDAQFSTREFSRLMTVGDVEEALKRKGVAS